MKKLLVIAVLMLASSLAIALGGDPIPGASVKVGRKPPGGPHSIALSRQRHKLIYKLMTTEARYDKEILVASHLERIERDRTAAA